MNASCAAQKKAIRENIEISTEDKNYNGDFCKKVKDEYKEVILLLEFSELVKYFIGRANPDFTQMLDTAKAAERYLIENENIDVKNKTE